MEQHEKIRSVIKGMTQFEKRWVARALSGMVLADGLIDQGEIDVMKRFIALVGDETIRDEVNQILNLGIEVVLEKHPFTAEQAAKILFEVSAMSFADLVIDDMERNYLTYVGSQLSLSESTISEVARLASDQCQIESQMNTLIEQLGQ